MYYLLTLQNDSIPSVRSYETEEDVAAAFHQELAYRHESRYSTICAILDDELGIIRREEYHVPVSNNTSEPTEG